MFYQKQVEKYDVNTFLTGIVDEFLKLEDGCPMTIGGRTETIYSTLTAVVADNLASHQVGGFKAGFSTGFRKCRSCLGLDEDIQTKFRDADFIPRNKADHDAQCEGLNLELLHQHYSRLYGINKISVFNKHIYFHVIGGLAPDIMHDLLEGVIPLVLALFIAHCIDRKYFTFKQLNHIIANFNYGRAEVVDKPARITSKHLKDYTIRGSATQKWLLAVYFLVMVGSKIDTSDPALHCYRLLLEICRLVFKTSLSTLQLSNLENFIADFLAAFKECFPSRRLIPKMHHLVHYPRFIREIGPLGAVWCMRYEAIKHAYFKSLQRRSGNWINLPWSLSYRHQQ